MLVKKKQVLLIIICCIVYCANYMCRSSYGANINCFIDEYSISITEAGIISTLFFFSYGVGQIINSFISPHYNKRLSISLPLLGLGLLTLINFFELDFNVYKFVWVGCGICSSFLWSSLMKLTSDNVDDSLTGGIVIGFSVAISIGMISSYLFSSLFVHIGNFRLVFLVASIFAILASIIFFFVVKNYNYTPKMVNSSVNEKGTPIYEKKKAPSKGFIFLVFFMLSATLCNVVMDSLLTWTPTILKNEFNFTNSLSIFLGVVLPLVRSFSGFFNAFLDKRKIKRFVLISILMSVAAIAFVGSVLSLDKHTAVLLIICSIITFVPYHCFNNLITCLIPLKIRAFYDSGVLAGVVDGFAYAGSALSTFAIPLFVEGTSWIALFYLFIGISVVILFTALILFLCFRKKEEYELFL